jgi:ABC-type sugar transport system ATPase subunit
MDENVPLLQMKGVQKSFGHVRVLRDIDLEINYGEIVALIGDNGAGKSTLIKIITGVYAPTAGEVYFRSARLPSSRSCGATSSPATSRRISSASSTSAISGARPRSSCAHVWA